MNIIPIPAGAVPQTMTSREIADLVESRHDSVKRTIERLVDGMIIASPPMVDGEKAANNQVERVFLVSKRDSYVIVAQLSPEFTARLVDRWQELEGAEPVRALSPAEMFLQNAQAMVDMERRQIAQEQAVAKVEQRIEEVAQTQLLTSRPQNAESITTLRARAAKKFGIPERVVEHVIRQTPYAPRPAGMVRNDNESAQGSTYAVYWIKDINDVMRRFAGECEMVTPAFATHPFIEGRFKKVPA